MSEQLTKLCYKLIRKLISLQKYGLRSFRFKTVTSSSSQGQTSSLLPPLLAFNQTFLSSQFLKKFHWRIAGICWFAHQSVFITHPKMRWDLYYCRSALGFSLTCSVASAQYTPSFQELVDCCRCRLKVVESIRWYYSSSLTFCYIFNKSYNIVRFPSHLWLFPVPELLNLPNAATF